MLFAVTTLEYKRRNCNRDDCPQPPYLVIATDVLSGEVLSARTEMTQDDVENTIMLWATFGPEESIIMQAKELFGRENVENG